jgi:hypothetical protein
MEMWFRISAFADVAYVEGVDQAWHREHPASLSAKHVDHFRDLVERRMAFETLFSGMAGGLTDAPALADAARAAIAAQAIDFIARECDFGRGAGEDARRYANFAVSVAPALHKSKQWTQLQGRMQARPNTLATTLLSIFGKGRRLAMAKMRERRWHRTGVT